MGIITILNKCEHPALLLCCKVNDVHEVITGSMDGVCRLIKIKNDGPVLEFQDDETKMKISSVTGISFQKNCLSSEVFVSSYADGIIKYWNKKTCACIRTIYEDRQTLCLVQNPQDNKFLSLGSDGNIYYYDMETGNKLRSFMNSTNKLEGHTSRVFGATFHPINAQEFISGGWDNSVLYWDLRKPAAFRYILGPHICGDGLDINPSGLMIMACSYDTEKPLSFYEYATGRMHISFDNNKTKLYCGKWLGPWLTATGSTDPSNLSITDMYSVRVVSNYKTNSTGIYSMDTFNLQSRRKIKRDDSSTTNLVFTSGKVLIIAKVTHGTK